jgi:hypothetical protein
VVKRARWKVSAGPPLLIAGLLFAVACAASDDDPVEVSLNEDFQLRIGQSAQVSDAEMKIGFQAVTSDSRCAKGETCITEGDAIVRIWLEDSGGTREERDLHTGSQMARATDFANFSIGLVALHPERISGRNVEPEQYLATLRVVRGASGGELIY